MRTGYMQQPNALERTTTVTNEAPGQAALANQVIQHFKMQ